MRGERRRRRLVLAPLLLGAGCAVGPDFARPPPPVQTHYTAAPLPAETETAAGRAQRFVPEAAVPAAWWELFRSPELNARIAQALAANPTLRAAQATLRASRDQLRAGYGVFLPQVDLGGGAVRERPFVPIPGSGRETFDVYSVSASVSYVLDVFGAERRAVESQGAQTEARLYETAATYLTLIANVANATVAEAGYAAQIAFTGKLIADEREQVDVTRAQANAGTVPWATLSSLEAQLAASEAQLAPLEQQLDHTRHLLATLLGTEPGASGAAPVSLEDLDVPQDVPVTLPSVLVRRRPDILAAEAQLHSAAAEVGVATAAMFPQITLSGSYGWTSTAAAALFSGPAAAWVYGAQVVSPLFHGGELWFKRRAAIATWEASMETYRQTVLAGLAQVADTLAALEHDAAQVAAQVRQEAAAREARRLIAIDYRWGVADYVQLLIADTQWNAASIARIGGQAQRLQDTVALFTALGGGWWDVQDSVLGAAGSPPDP
ncbi:MAG: efflux transporter outer membrane subunit [bacterium]|nr:efflux transporter outer membrane subunit [bacterium]